MTESNRKKRTKRMSQIVEVKLPDIGDFDKVDVIEIQVAPGVRVEQESPLITLESDKATMEIPSPHAGTVRDLAVKVGQQISQGELILTLELDEAAAAASDAADPPAHTPADSVNTAPPPAPASPPSEGDIQAEGQGRGE